MILVSGGSGLVGSHLLRLLIKKGEAVRATYRSSSSIKACAKVFEAFNETAHFEEIDWVQADLLDLTALEKAFEGVDQVYHSAAMVSFKRKDRPTLFEVNVQGTANMVNLALDFKVKKFCFVSSVAAIGKYRDKDCSDERASWKQEGGTSDYSISKYYAENEVWRGAAEGLPIVIVNPSTVLGYGDLKRSSNKLFEKVDRGLPFYPGGSNGFVGVDDVVQCMYALMESEIQGERFILSSENISYQQLFNSIAEALEKKPPSFELQKWMATLYMYLDSFLFYLGLQDSPITRANLTTAFNHKCFDTAKIKDRLGFDFEPIEAVTKRHGGFYRRES